MSSGAITLVAQSAFLGFFGLGEVLRLELGIVLTVCAVESSGIVF